MPGENTIAVEQHQQKKQQWCINFEVYLSEWKTQRIKLEGMTLVGITYNKFHIDCLMSAYL